MDLIRSISWISASHLRLARDDDSYVDRLSHRYTVAILVLFAIVVTTKQYAGDPIDCWVPAQFKASYEKYADSYCWIAGSWYIPLEKDLLLTDEEKRQNRIKYYQWVPFLLLFQAILFYLPRIIWRCLNVRSGLNLVNLVDAAIKYENVDKFNDRDKIMSYIISNIERHIGARRNHYDLNYGRASTNNKKFYKNSNRKETASKKRVAQDDPESNRYNEFYSSVKSGDRDSCEPCNYLSSSIRKFFSFICFWSGKHLGNYLIVLYIFVKTLWLTNAISQLFLLNRFIGNDYHAFGLDLIQMLLSGNDWNELKHFPRVTYCDFKIREVGNIHDWTVQCVLRINLFNEVIYIFIWFWLCLLVIFITLDYINWLISIVFSGSKLRFIKRHLDVLNFYTKVWNANSSDSDKKTDSENDADKLDKSSNSVYIDIDKEKELMRDFTFEYLKDDCIFALRILASNTSDIMVTEILNELWKNFKKNFVEPSESAMQSKRQSPVNNLKVKVYLPKNDDEEETYSGKVHVDSKSFTAPAVSRSYSSDETKRNKMNYFK